MQLHMQKGIMFMRRFVSSLVSIVLVLVLVVACSDVPEETVTEEVTRPEETIIIEEVTGPEETTMTEEVTRPEDTTTEDVTTDEETAQEPDPPTDESPELMWIFEYEDVEFAPRSLAIHPDGELVTVGAYMATYTHRLYDGELTNVDTDYRHSVERLSFSPDGRYLAAGLSVYGVLAKDWEGEIEPLQVHGGYDNFAAFSPTGEFLATGNRTGDIWIWSMPDCEQIAELSDGEKGYLWGLAYHPSGEQIASLQYRDDGVINIWSIKEEQLIHTMIPDILVGGSNNVISYSPDGSFFGAYFRENWEHSIRIFDTDEYALEVEIPLEKRATQIAFSPDGQMIAVASIHAPTTIWSTTTGELLYVLDQEIEETTDGTKSLAFTPDGGYLAAIRNGSGDLELWRLPGAEPIPEPEIDIYQPVPIPGDVLFDTGSSDLKAEADDVLAALAEEILTVLKEAKLTFIGHTDSRGDASANMQLSIDRATSVKNWFETWSVENSVDGWDFDVEGRGETQLKTPDVDGEGNFRDEAGRINRRVEIDIEPIE